MGRHFLIANWGKNAKLINLLGKIKETEFTQDNESRIILRLGNFIDRFLDYLNGQKGYSQNTIRNYQVDLRQFSEFLASRKGLTGKEDLEADFGAIDCQTIREYLGSLYGRFKRSTVARKLSAVRSFFLFLERTGLSKDNPAADIATPKLEKYIPSHLTVDDVFRLLERPEKKRPLGLRDLAILEVLYSCGIRVSELQRLKIGSIDFRERLVRVIGKGDKERIVPIGKRPSRRSETTWRQLSFSEGKWVGIPRRPPFLSILAEVLSQRGASGES